MNWYFKRRLKIKLFSERCMMINFLNHNGYHPNKYDIKKVHTFDTLLKFKHFNSTSSGNNLISDPLVVFSIVNNNRVGAIRKKHNTISPNNLFFN